MGCCLQKLWCWWLPSPGWCGRSLSGCAVGVAVLSRTVLLVWPFSLGLCCCCWPLSLRLCFWCGRSLSGCAVGVAALFFATAVHWPGSVESTYPTVSHYTRGAPKNLRTCYRDHHARSSWLCLCKINMSLFCLLVRAMPATVKPRLQGTTKITIHM